MGFAGKIPGLAGLGAPPPVAGLASGPSPMVTAWPQEQAAALMFGNKQSAVSSANAAVPATPGQAPKKGGGGTFPGFTPNETTSALQAPMTGNKTLTGQ